MPLSPPVKRKHVHTREIRCLGFEREDGLWDIEGRITDTKTYTFDNRERGMISAGTPVHDMLVRLTVDTDLVVQDAEASTEAGPFEICNFRYGFHRMETYSRHFRQIIISIA